MEHTLRVPLEKKSEWFKHWFDSEYYHKLYGNRDEREAEDFIRRLVNKLAPESGSSMLDMGCGKGRHARLLNSLGFDVTGLDLSGSSIRAAQAYENKSLRFFEHDMRLPYKRNHFDYVLSFFTSFGYFETDKENDDVVNSLATAMKPSGTLMLDYLNVAYSEAGSIALQKKQIGSTNFSIVKWFTPTHFHKQIIIEEAFRQYPVIFEEKVAKFRLGDFDRFLRRHHMQITEVFGDYMLNSYHELTSPRLILLARKIPR